MILVAESGASKTDWRLLESSGAVENDKTDGINPFHQSLDDIINIISGGSLISKSKAVKKIFYYGAGCNYPEQVAKVEQALRQFYIHADIYVTHDLLAAARASCGSDEGIACILGTGSNSCLYNGKQIIASSPSLGYILGDEGSGAFMGKKLIRDFMFNKMPKTLWNKLVETHEVSLSDVLERIYTRQGAHKYLASFAYFIKENIEHPYMHGLVYESFNEFLDRHVMMFDKSRELPINFVGSIADSFEDILHASVDDLGLNFGKVVKSPISGLVHYHQQSL